ncbi:Hypothetical protein, partial CDS, partial [Neorhizobium galegae bv. officinalis]
MRKPSYCRASVCLILFDFVANGRPPLVNRIDLIPDGAELVIVLRGDLAAILTFASGKKRPQFPNEKAILEDLMGCTGAPWPETQKAPRGGFVCYRRYNC